MRSPRSDLENSVVSSTGNRSSNNVESARPKRWEPAHVPNGFEWGDDVYAL